MIYNFLRVINEGLPEVLSMMGTAFGYVVLILFMFFSVAGIVLLFVYIVNLILKFMFSRKNKG